MGLSVKAEWVEAFTRLERRSEPSRSARFREARVRGGESRTSKLACQILAVFADRYDETVAELKISALNLPHETDPALAAALSELASTGLIRVAGAGSIELTSKGRDVIRSGTRAGVLRSEPKE